MIDYLKIALAVKHYKTYCSRPFEELDVPWIVSWESIWPTLPLGRDSFGVTARGDRHFEMGHLVASGEQSFIQIRNSLKPGRRYLCTTPCFRNEYKIDECTRPHFMKVELIDVLSKREDPEKKLLLMLGEANNFFKQYADTAIVRTPEGFDIEIGGIEVGSYGFRHYDGFRWIYGTGCAEPRLSFAVNVLEELLDKEWGHGPKVSQRRRPRTPKPTTARRKGKGAS